MKMTSSNIYTSNFRRCWTDAPTIARISRVTRERIRHTCATPKRERGRKREGERERFFSAFTRDSIRIQSISRFRTAIFSKSTNARIRTPAILRRINGEARSLSRSPYRISAVTAFDLFVSSVASRQAEPIDSTDARATDGTKDTAHYRFFSRRRATNGAGAETTPGRASTGFAAAMKTS